MIGVIEIEVWAKDEDLFASYVKFGHASASLETFKRRRTYGGRKGRRAACRLQEHEAYMGRITRYYHHRYGGADAIRMVVRHWSSDPGCVDIQPPPASQP